MNNEESKKLIAVLKEDLEKESKQCEWYKSEHEDLVTRISNLEGEVQSLQKEVDDLKYEKKQLIKQIDETENMLWNSQKDIPFGDEDESPDQDFENSSIHEFSHKKSKYSKRLDQT